MIILLFLLTVEAFAEVQVKVISFMRNNQLKLDNYFLWQEKTFDNKIQLRLEVMPIKDEKFAQIIGYSGKIFTDYGTFILGKRGDDFSFPDAAATNFEEAFGLTKEGYNKKLLLDPSLERGVYPLKFAYLSPKIDGNYYLTLLSQAEAKEVTFFSEGTMGFFDLRGALSLSNSKEVPYNLGFNGQVLGLALGFSFSPSYQTLGLAYAIGPVKVGITGLATSNNLIKKLSLQYKFSKNLSSFITLGSSLEEKLIICGMKFNF